MEESLSDIARRLECAVSGLENAIIEQYNNILLSCAEAGRQLGVRQNTVTRYIREGRLHKTTIGQSTGIRLSEVMVMKLKTP